MRTQLVGELPVVVGEECYMHVVYFLKTPKLFNYKLVSIYNGDFSEQLQDEFGYQICMDNCMK